MAKISLEREKCIGDGSCAALCPKYFELKDDGKAHIIGAELKGSSDVEELEVEKLECAKNAAEACPTQCIHVLNN